VARGAERRGPQAQLAARERERAAHRRVVRLVRWQRRSGRSREATSRDLGVSIWSVRRWEREWRRNRLKLCLRGRPQRRADAIERREVALFLWWTGMRASVAELQHAFPNLARAELKDLRERWRRTHDRRWRRRWLALEWTRVGAVWALDLSDPPELLEGRWKKVLCVRDLSSGTQLLSQGLERESAGRVAAALVLLFALYGAPLVLKSDNGKVFLARVLARLLEEWGVLALLSPIRTPRYNGAIEAGIGALKARAEATAIEHGRSRAWTLEDLEAARVQGNASALPRGPRGSTPNEAWQARRRVSKCERRSLRAAFERALHEVRAEFEQAGGRVPPASTVQRVALGRALSKEGYLKFRRGRFSPPISSR
jgi:transposase